QIADALLERRRHVCGAEAAELALEPALELGARVAAPACAQVPLDLIVIGVGELAVEILREESQRVLTAHRVARGGVRHCCSVVPALSPTLSQARAAIALFVAPNGRVPVGIGRCRSGSGARRRSPDTRALARPRARPLHERSRAARRSPPRDLRAEACSRTTAPVC